MKNYLLVLLCLSLLSSTLLSAAEIIVGANAACKTINDGVKLLKDGDTLIIEPGRYHESIDIKRQLKNCTIKARIPGSVLIYGDKVAPKFTKLPGYRFIYVTDWSGEVTAVNERDCLRVYIPGASIRDLEFNFGSWYKKDGKLYISTTDGQEPDKHDLTISAIRNYGLRLHKPEKVTIDGLTVCAFYSPYHLDAWSGVAGIRLTSGKNCVVKNCRAFLNSNGISFSGENMIIDNCIAYANGSGAPTAGANIVGWGGTNNIIRNSTSMFRLPQGVEMGLRFYMGNITNCNIDNCISFGEAGLNIKGTVKNSKIINSYSERTICSAEGENNIFGGSLVNGYNPKESSLLKGVKQSDWSKLYADPDNHDFRPIAKVHIGMPKVIKDNMTIILPPGNYPQINIAANNVTVKTRGNKSRATLGGANISGNNVKLDNLVFFAPVIVSGNNVTLFSCEFADSANITGDTYGVTHCRFAKAPTLSGKGYRHSNIGCPKDVLDDGRSLDAFPLGPYRLSRSTGNAKISGPFIRNITDNAVDIEWWTSSPEMSSELCWGTTEKCENEAGQSFTGGYWHSMSLTTLQPGTKYYFKVNSRTPLREHHSNMELAVLNRQAKRTVFETAVLAFTTLPEKPTPRTLTVTGNNISEVLDQARPGDTVQIKGGVYNETLYVRASGLTLRNVPNEKVWIDGKRILSQGIVLENKPGTTIDGLFFREQLDRGAGITINGGRDITITRCFYDGRSKGYTPEFIKANMVLSLTVANCFITRGFYGATFWRCPGLTIRNCVFINNQIKHIYIHNLPEEKAKITHNIIFDNVPQKTRNPLIDTLNIESLRESDNCYYLRTPKKYRKIVGYTRIEGDQVNEEANYADFLRESSGNGNSIFKNPQVKSMPQILIYQHPETMRSGSLLATHDYDKESLELEKKALTAEYKLIDGKYEPWDFSGWFATDPECIKRNIGIDSKLFSKGAAK